MNIFVFTRFENNAKCYVIADMYRDAIDMMYTFTDYANWQYDLHNYEKYDIKLKNNSLIKILGFSPEEYNQTFFINEKQFKKIKGKKKEEGKILTKNVINKLTNGNNMYPFWTLNEFKEGLKQLYQLKNEKR